MSREERSQRLNSLTQSIGWYDMVLMLTEQINGYKDELYQIMSSKPDTLTGKSAIRLASKAKALEEFKESIDDEVRISNPSTRIGQGS